MGTTLHLKQKSVDVRFLKNITVEFVVMEFFGLDLSSAVFWSAFGSIMLANIVLSGDNAVVIAMAARTLEPEQRGKAIF